MRVRVAMLMVVCLVLVAAGSVQAQDRLGGKVFDKDPNLPGPAVEGAAELVTDGGFEAGTPNPNWGESSTNFGTPLCDVPSCGQGGGTGPHAGAWWTWFGGIGIPESGAVWQNIQGGANDSCTLSFYLEIPVASGNGSDFVRALIGGVEVWSALESTPGYATYAQVSMDVSGAIDGTSQELRFESTISGTPDLTNFFIDDVSVFCEEGEPVPTMPSWAMLVLALMLAAGTLLAWKRQQA